jgi:hypothetical protein
LDNARDSSWAGISPWVWVRFSSNARDNFRVRIRVRIMVRVIFRVIVSGIASIRPTGRVRFRPQSKVGAMAMITVMVTV